MTVFYYNCRRTVLCGTVVIVAYYRVENFHLAYCGNVVENGFRRSFFAVGCLGYGKGKRVAVYGNRASIVTVNIVESFADLLDNGIGSYVFVKTKRVSAFYGVCIKTACLDKTKR